MNSGKRTKTFEIAQQSLREGRLEGIIDAPESGRWGKWKYGMRGKTQWCQPYTKPTDPGTAPQKEVRGALGSVSGAWRTKLTQEQRQAWNLAARGQRSKPRNGQSGPLEGEQVFVRHSTVLKRVGKEMLLWPAPRPMFPPNPVAGLSITYGSAGVRIALRVSGPVREDIMVLGQAACSAGRNKWRSGAYLCLLPAAEDGECDITAEYVARFGEPEPGKKVFIRTQQQRDGWKDFLKDLSEVVPARVGKGECGVWDGERGMGAACQAPAASAGLQGLNGLHRSYKLQEVNGLRGSGGLHPDGAAGSRAGGMAVRCTRGWFRVATTSIASQYRWGTRKRWQMANGKWQNEGVGGRDTSRHWRELYHGR